MIALRGTDAGRNDWSVTHVLDRTPGAERTLCGRRVGANWKEYPWRPTEDTCGRCREAVRRRMPDQERSRTICPHGWDVAVGEGCPDDRGCNQGSASASATTRRSVGRPPLDDPRRHVVRFRLSDAEMLTISSAAVQAGYDSTAAWVRDVALKVARGEA